MNYTDIFYLVCGSHNMANVIVGMIFIGVGFFACIGERVMDGMKTNPQTPVHFDIIYFINDNWFRFLLGLVLSLAFTRCMSIYIHVPYIWMFAMVFGYENYRLCSSLQVVGQAVLNILSNKLTNP